MIIGLLLVIVMINLLKNYYLNLKIEKKLQIIQFLLLN